MDSRRKSSLLALIMVMFLIVAIFSTEPIVSTSLVPNSAAAWGAFSIEAGGGWTAMVCGVAATAAVGAYYGSCFTPGVGTVAGIIIGL
jgi:hypothetical protein